MSKSDEQAIDTLNRIREDLMNRLSTVEGEIKRLTEERDALGNVLSRISPPQPQPVANVYPSQNPALGMLGGERRW